MLLLVALLFVRLGTCVDPEQKMLLKYYTPPVDCNVTASCCSEQYLNMVLDYKFTPENNRLCDPDYVGYLTTECHFEVSSDFQMAMKYECVDDFDGSDLPKTFSPYLLLDYYNQTADCEDPNFMNLYTYRYYAKYSTCGDVVCFMGEYRFVFTSTFDDQVIFQLRYCDSDEMLFEMPSDTCTTIMETGEDEEYHYRYKVYIPDEVKQDVETYTAYDTCSASRYGSASSFTGGRLCGDPHFTTFDGNRYSFQELGEYYLVRTNTFDITTTFVQMEGSNSVSVTQAFKVFYKDHTIEVQFDTETEGYNFIFDDGDPLDVDSIQTVMECGTCVSLAMLKGEDVQRTGEFFDDMTISIHDFELYKASLEFHLEDGTKIIANHRRGWWCMSVLLGEAHFGTTKGLLGVWNRQEEDDFVDVDGTTYTDPTDEEIYNFAVSWEVGTTSKRRAAMAEGYEPLKVQDVEKYLSDNGVDIDDLCQGVDDVASKINCAYDVVVGGVNETEIAGQYVEFEEEISKAVESNRPPFLAGNQGKYVMKIGEEFKQKFDVYDPDEDDEIEFTVFENNCTGFTVDLKTLEDGDSDTGAQAQVSIDGTFTTACRIVFNVTDTAGSSKMAKVDLILSEGNSITFPDYGYAIIAVGVVACCFAVILILAVVIFVVVVLMKKKKQSKVVPTSSKAKEMKEKEEN